MTILITGSAGFIGSNFVLDWRAQSDKPISNLDPRSCAGNRQNLSSLNTDRRHGFVRVDIGEGRMVDSMLALHKPRAIINFTAESHVDRSFHGPGECIQAHVVGTLQVLKSARAKWGHRDECARSAA